MPTSAYILIETAVGKSRDIANTLRSVPEVETVDTVTGPYDIIALVEGWLESNARMEIRVV